MTATAAQTARTVAAAETVIVETQPADGPESIEGYYDEVFSIPGLINNIRKHNDCDGHIVPCFDNTGLDAARCIANGPVAGLCESACIMASMVANRFSIVTTLSRSVPALEKLTLHYGMTHRCGSIRAADVPVLDLEQGDAASAIKAQIELAIDQDAAEAIVLGCAGMADFAASLSDEFAVPVVDGVSAAVKLIEGLVSMKLTTSRANGYAAPRAKNYLGMFAADAPPA
jgi:allantoin racemase